MAIGGELLSLLKDIDYNSKQELLDKLRAMRDDLKNYPKRERRKIKSFLHVAIQQAFYTSEYALMQYKKSITKKDKLWKKNAL